MLKPIFDRYFQDEGPFLTKRHQVLQTDHITEYKSKHNIVSEVSLEIT